jgi:hypothetical protein
MEMDAGQEWLLELDVPFMEMELFLSTRIGKRAALSLYYPVSRRMIYFHQGSQRYWDDESSLDYRDTRYRKGLEDVRSGLELVRGIEERWLHSFADVDLPDLSYPNSERVILRATDQVGIDLAEFIDAVDRVLQMADKLWFGKHTSIEEKNTCYMDVMKAISNLRQYRWKDQPYQHDHQQDQDHQQDHDHQENNE